MESFGIDAENGSGSQSRRKGLFRPPILLVILFWHHVVSGIIILWCGIGIVVVPDFNNNLSSVLVMALVQMICGLSGIYGAYKKKSTLIYYYGCSQGLLAIIELFWSVISLLNGYLICFCMLLVFCLYQIFLAFLTFHYKFTECEWKTLNHIWPFEIGVHPNHLPSAADKLPDQLSELPFPMYNNLREIQAPVKQRSELLRNENEKEKHEPSKPQLPPPLIKRGPENILKSVHPTTDELSSISTQSGKQESKQVLLSIVTATKPSTSNKIDVNSSTTSGGNTKVQPSIMEKIFPAIVISKDVKKAAVSPTEMNHLFYNEKQDLPISQSVSGEEQQLSKDKFDKKLEAGIQKDNGKKKP